MKNGRKNGFCLSNLSIRILGRGLRKFKKHVDISKLNKYNEKQYNKCYDGEKDIKAYLQRVGNAESQQ